ncbi:putative xenobiotic-transporting ATPase [Rosa chinensis]|uniref:Putative xenobiotic-transporting ATPase n=1 Tax=Rosa chinensis TaxID=74649 RepID=A0A2P6R0N4_ROSCH|nr:putative xenobiotic-transporting ATPase [Rosa chinensis]
MTVKLESSFHCKLSVNNRSSTSSFGCLRISESLTLILASTNMTPSSLQSMETLARPNSKWPTEGQIEFQNVQVQYKPEDPMVLKRITCTFSTRMKIGVVGRTGSGKSTMIQASFRVVELSGGKILIDEQDISKIGLLDLGSSLGIIPQDRTLFQGTLRNNPDPLQQHSDLEILEVAI